MVSKIFSCSEFPEKDGENRPMQGVLHFNVRPWSLLTILNFSVRGQQTQRYFNVSSPSSRRE